MSANATKIVTANSTAQDMTQKRKKPETPDELQADIENHPERGMFKADNDGRLVPAVRVNSIEVRGDIPAEAYEMLLIIWGAKGLEKGGGVKDMVMQYITDLGNLQLAQRKEQMKAEVFGVSPRDVRSKVKGFYKARGRERRARLVYKPGEEG
jgi:hypothetical protein